MRLAVCRLNGCKGHEAGRELLEMLCRAETGQALPEIRIAQRGKPYFTDSPLHFSISHTRTHAVCVLAHCPVGVDAEELDRPVRESLAKRALSPMEYRQFERAENSSEAFLRFWVLKEAAAKLSGEGLQGFPNHTEFVLPDERIRVWDGCLIALMAKDETEGVEFYAV